MFAPPRLMNKSPASGKPKGRTRGTKQDESNVAATKIDIRSPPKRDPTTLTSPPTGRGPTTLAHALSSKATGRRPNVVSPAKSQLSVTVPSDQTTSGQRATDLEPQTAFKNLTFSSPKLNASPTIDNRKNSRVQRVQIPQCSPDFVVSTPDAAAHAVWETDCVLQSLEWKVESAQEKVKHAEEEHRKVEMKLQSSKEELNALMKLVAGARADLTTVTKELGATKVKLLAVEAELAAQEGKLDDTLKDREAALQELLHLQQQLLGLRKDVAQSDGREESREQEPLDAGEQLEALRAHLATVQDTLAARLEELKLTQDKLAAAQAGLCAAKDEAAAARAENKNVAGAGAVKNGPISARQRAEIKSLKQQVSKLKDEKAALLAETGINVQWFTEEKAAQRQALLAELNTALAQVTTLEGQLEQVQQERDGFKIILETREEQERITGGTGLEDFALKDGRYTSRDC